MRPVSQSILATCILTAFWPASAKCEPVSLWNSNGSVMAMEVVGSHQVFRYQEPRIGLRQEGVVPGTVRFKGTKSGNTYLGTAFVFSRRCGAHPFQVTGTISNDEREIAMYGTAPVGFDAACRPVIYRKDGVHFSFLRFVNPPPLAASAIAPDRDAAEAAPDRARLAEAQAAEKHQEQRLRDSLEQQHLEARDLREQQERAERVRRERELGGLRLEELRSFSNRRDECRKYNSEACDIALNSSHASGQDIADLRNWRGAAEKFAADLDRCRTGSVAACDEALASPAVPVERRSLLNEWRIAALPFNRAVALLSTYAGTVAKATVNGVGVIRNLPTSAHVAGGLAAVLGLALGAAALRRRYPYPSGRPQALAPSAAQKMTTSATNQARSAVASLQRRSDSLTRWFAIIPRLVPPAARDTPGAIEAIELAHGYIEEVREADTPTLADHKVRKLHLNMLTLASRQLDAAQKLDPDAILEGQDENGAIHRFSIDGLRGEALLLEGITLHPFDVKRAIRAIRKATKFNAKSSYAFYVLGVMLAGKLHKAEAMAALRRAVALKPDNLSYRKELNRAQSLSAGEIAAYKIARARESIFKGGIKAWNIFAGENILGSPRRIFLSICRGTLRAGIIATRRKSTMLPTAPSIMRPKSGGADLSPDFPPIRSRVLG